MLVSLLLVGGNWFAQEESFQKQQGGIEGHGPCNVLVAGSNRLQCELV